MAATGPVQQRREQPVVAGGEDLLGDHRAVVHRPAPDDRVERSDQRLVWCCLVRPDDVAHALMMPLDGVLAGLDERLIRGLFPSAATGSELSGVIAADVESQKLEPGRPVQGESGVSDPGLARFQTQSDTAQPFLRDTLRFLDPFPGRMQDHEVVGVGHDLGTVAATER